MVLLAAGRMRAVGDRGSRGDKNERTLKGDGGSCQRQGRRAERGNGGWQV